MDPRSHDVSLSHNLDKASKAISVTGRGSL
jgi:hypothetical protein